MKTIEAKSFEERVESKLSWSDKNHHVSNVEVVLTKPEGSYLVKEWYPGGNLITDAADIYYVKKLTGVTPAQNENFLNAQCELANPSTQVEPAKNHVYSNLTSPINASRKVKTTGYPKASDTDTDNTGPVGADIMTYAYSWTTAEAVANGIKNGAMYDHSSPLAGTLLFSLFKVTSFNKTNADTMKLFNNIESLGVAV
jgi:hypothetical protein